MNSFILEEATVRQIHGAVQKGKITFRWLVEQYLKRIETYEKPLNSIILLNPNALKEGEELDRIFREKGLVGSLHGIPILLKDNCETADMPTTAGSKSLEGWNSGRDSFLVRKLREAGGIIIAKTNLHEFAVWGETVSSMLGQSYNPYDYTRTPGGSSGGTGAAVAANFGVIGIGTDTINSIRSPASACALVGFRPTIGLVSRSGIVPYSLTQDTAGPITRTVEDCARTLDVIVGADPSDPITKSSEGKIPESYTAHLKKDGLRGKRIGVVKGFIGKEETHRPVNLIFDQCRLDLLRAGAELIVLGEDFDSAALVREVSVHLYDLDDDLSSYLGGFGDKVPVHSVKEILSSGKYVKNIEENFREAITLKKDSEEYKKRLKKRTNIQDKVSTIMIEYKLDALVYPHQQQLVCKVGGSQLGRNGVLASVTGYPAVTVPAGFTPPSEEAPLGVPVGVEFFGKPFSEGILLEIAYGYEQTYPHRIKPILTRSMNYE